MICTGIEPQCPNEGAGVVEVSHALINKQVFIKIKKNKILFSAHIDTKVFQKIKKNIFIPTKKNKKYFCYNI